MQQLYEHRILPAFASTPPQHPPSPRASAARYYTLSTEQVIITSPRSNVEIFREEKMLMVAAVAKVLVGVKRQRYERLGSCRRRTQTPAGFLPVYVGEQRQRFTVPTGYLSHPLFRALLEEAQSEYGFEQRSGLSLPCTVSVFQAAVDAVHRGHAYV